MYSDRSIAGKILSNRPNPRRQQRQPATPDSTSRKRPSQAGTSPRRGRSWSTRPQARTRAPSALRSQGAGANNAAQATSEGTTATA